MAWKFEKPYSAQYPIIAGHRGFSLCYPENTLRAFEEAAKLGVDMVELDISMSADGIPMLYHDDLLEKKSAPLAGNITGFTREELRQVRIGAKLGMEDQPMATLEEFCQLYNKYPDIVVNVDLKPGSGVEGTVKPVMEILEKYGYMDRIFFNSLDGNITKHLHDNTEYLVVGPPEGFAWGVNQVPGPEGTYATLDAVCIPTSELSMEAAEELRRLGKIVVSAPMADEAAAQKALEVGVEICVCDDPRPMLKLMGRLP